MNKLVNKYHTLSSREKKQVLIISALMVLGAYLLIAALMWEQMFHAQKMANRKENRIETRIGDYEAPEIDAAYSPKVLKKITVELTGIEQQLIAINSQLLPLDDPEAKEASKLIITRLATKHGVEVISLNTINNELRPLPAELSGETLRSIFTDRPLFKVHSRGDYYDFIRFVDDLPTLPFLGFIQNLEIKLSEESGLDIHFDLQM